VQIVLADNGEEAIDKLNIVEFDIIIFLFANAGYGLERSHPDNTEKYKNQLKRNSHHCTYCRYNIRNTKKN
jgi:hypothetical protein